MVNPSMALVVALHGNGVKTNKEYDPETGRLERLHSFSPDVFFNYQEHAYVWDEVGNLKNRTDTSTIYGSSSLAPRNLTEAFTYDGLNRLETATVTDLASSSVLSAQAVTYSLNGNIASKSDVGSYIYAQTGHAGPHAVTSAGGVIQASGGFSYPAAQQS